MGHYIFFLEYCYSAYGQGSAPRSDSTDMGKMGMIVWWVQMSEFANSSQHIPTCTKIRFCTTTADASHRIYSVDHNILHNVPRLPTRPFLYYFWWRFKLSCGFLIGETAIPAGQRFDTFSQVIWEWFNSWRLWVESKTAIRDIDWRITSEMYSVWIVLNGDKYSNTINQNESINLKSL